MSVESPATSHALPSPDGVLKDHDYEPDGDEVIAPAGIERSTWPPIIVQDWAMRQAFEAAMTTPGFGCRIRYYTERDSATHAASKIKRGRYADLPPGRWDACTRLARGGVGWWLWVCYEPKEEPR